jgi:hypothetical protein
MLKRFSMLSSMKVLGKLAIMIAVAGELREQDNSAP